MAEEKRKRVYNEARKRANQKWDAEHMERVSVAIETGEKERIKAAAAAAGESVNAYIKGAISQRMEREKE